MFLNYELDDFDALWYTVMWVVLRRGLGTPHFDGEEAVS
jgi:hypothetical protein